MPRPSYTEDSVYWMLELAFNDYHVIKDELEEDKSRKNLNKQVKRLDSIIKAFNIADKKIGVYDAEMNEKLPDPYALAILRFYLQQRNPQRLEEAFSRVDTLLGLSPNCYGLRQQLDDSFKADMWRKSYLKKAEQENVKTEAKTKDTAIIADLDNPDQNKYESAKRKNSRNKKRQSEPVLSLA